MKQMPVPFEIFPMQQSDISSVATLEQTVYGPHYTLRDYDYELQKNPLAHYFVLRPYTQPDIIGHTGFWLIADELHISTIAVHPDWQQLGLGEWLLLAILEKGQVTGVERATLEVRVSNHIAIRLYQKYQFQEVGHRLRYYGDGEDALILTSPLLATTNYQTLLQQRKHILEQRFANL